MRFIPREFGPWQTIYYCFRNRKPEGVFEDIIAPSEIGCLTIDYEHLAETAEAMVRLAFTQIMLNKFCQ